MPEVKVLNISNRAMVVMRGRRIENNHYRLERSVVTEESDAVAAAQDQQGAYRLWHYRLGHMGDRWIKKLSKHGLIPHLDGGISDVCEL